VKICSIKTDTWLDYFQNLWPSKVNELTKASSNNEYEDFVSFGELIKSLNTQKITKHPGKMVYKWSSLNMLEIPLFPKLNLAGQNSTKKLAKGLSSAAT
jgi:hypothetical protein